MGLRRGEKEKTTHATGISTMTMLTKRSIIGNHDCTKRVNGIMASRCFNTYKLRSLHDRSDDGLAEQ